MTAVNELVLPGAAAAAVVAEVARHWPGRRSRLAGSCSPSAAADRSRSWALAGVAGIRRRRDLLQISEVALTPCSPHADEHGLWIPAQFHSHARAGSFMVRVRPSSTACAWTGSHDDRPSLRRAAWLDPSRWGWWRYEPGGGRRSATPGGLIEHGCGRDLRRGRPAWRLSTPALSARRQRVRSGGECSWKRALGLSRVVVSVDPDLAGAVLTARTILTTLRRLPGQSRPRSVTTFHRTSIDELAEAVAVIDPERPLVVGRSADATVRLHVGTGRGGSGHSAWCRTRTEPTLQASGRP